MNLEAFVSSLASSLEPGVPVSVLIDPMLGEPIPSEASPGGITLPDLVAAREQAWQRPGHVIRLAEGIALPLQLHPYLVELHGASDTCLAATAEIAFNELTQAQSGGLGATGAAAHRIGGWLQSSQPFDQVAQALSGMMRVNTQAITPARYQRLADRRALDWLCHVVGVPRVAAQLGRIQSWSYLDPCGQLVQLKSGSETASPLRLTGPEWAEFMQGDLLHQTVARWLGELAAKPEAEQAQRRSTRDCYAQAHAALEQAEAAARRWPQRFATPADRAAYAALNLLHPGIDQSPEFVAALNAPPAPDEPIETLDAMSTALHAMRLRTTS